MNALIVANTAIRQDANGRYCLNDLHRAAGGEKRHGASYWMGNQQTQELIAELKTTGNPVVSVEGRSGGTYVAKELVYAYAMWISPVFNLKVIRAYDAAIQPAQPKFQIPQTFAEALRLAADQQIVIENQQRAIVEKDRYVVASNEASIKAGEILVREFVKSTPLIDIGEKRFYKWMRRQGYLLKNSREPYQKFIKSGYFTWKPSAEEYNGKFRYTLRVTARGKVWLAAQYMKWQDNNERG